MKIKEKKIIYVLNMIIIFPILVYLVFRNILPSRLIIHFGPGAIKYTSTFNAMVLVPIFLLVLQQIINYKPEWIWLSNMKKRIYLVPTLMLVYYVFSFLLIAN